METSHFLENGNVPNEAKDSGCTRMKLCPLISLGLLILGVVPVLVTCFLCPCGQSPKTCWAHATYPSEVEGPKAASHTIRWQWKLTDCINFVRNESDQKLEVLHDGMYFVYAQVTRKTSTKNYFTLTLYKGENIILNQVTGPNAGEELAFINFGRPYFLSKGEKLFCSVNDGLKHIQTNNQTYWGLYKI